DRRTLLKLIGGAGATATVVSACGTTFGAGGDDSTASAAGSQWNKQVSVATMGPGGNQNWQLGDSLKFLPPEKIPTSGKASDLFSALPKEKLLTVYRRMNASRKW